MGEFSTSRPYPFEAPLSRNLSFRASRMLQLCYFRHFKLYRGTPAQSRSAAQTEDCGTQHRFGQKVCEGCFRSNFRSRKRDMGVTKGWWGPKSIENRQKKNREHPVLAEGRKKAEIRLYCLLSV